MGLDISKLGGVFKKASSKIDLSTLSTKKTTLSPEQMEGLKEAIKKLDINKLNSDKFQKIAKEVKSAKLPDFDKMLKK